MASRSGLKLATAALAALLAPAALVCGGGEAAAQMTLRFHTFVPAVSSSFKNVSAWAKKVEKESGGAVKFEMYPSMQLGGKPPDLYNQVKDGVVDAVYSIPGYTPGVFPRLEVFELPFVGTTAPATSLAVTEFYPKYLTEEFKDVHPIVFWSPGAPVFHVRGKPVRRLEDLQGRKIRIPTRPIGEMIAALGAVPVGIPGANITEAMLRGVVEIMVFPWAIAKANKTIDAAETHTIAVTHNSILMMAMNKRSYARLPAAARKAVDANSQEPVARWFGQQWEKDDEPGIKHAKELGHEIIVLSEAERARWKAKAEPVIDAWIKDMTAKGHPAQEMVDEARRLVAKYDTRK